MVLQGVVEESRRYYTSTQHLIDRFDRLESYPALSTIGLTYFDSSTDARNYHRTQVNYSRNTARWLLLRETTVIDLVTASATINNGFPLYLVALARVGQHLTTTTLKYDSHHTKNTIHCTSSSRVAPNLRTPFRAGWTHIRSTNGSNQGINRDAGASAVFTWQFHSPSSGSRDAKPSCYILLQPEVNACLVWVGRRGAIRLCLFVILEACDSFRTKKYRVFVSALCATPETFTPV